MKWGTISIALFVLLILGARKGSEMQVGMEWLREPDLEDVQSEQITDIPSTDIYLSLFHILPLSNPQTHGGFLKITQQRGDKAALDILYFRAGKHSKTSNGKELKF